MVDKFLAFFITVHIVAFTCFCVFLPCILQSLRNELHIEFRKFHLIQGISSLSSQVSTCSRWYWTQQDQVSNLGKLTCIRRQCQTVTIMPVAVAQLYTSTLIDSVAVASLFTNASGVAVVCLLYTRGAFATHVVMPSE